MPRKAPQNPAAYLVPAPAPVQEPIPRVAYSIEEAAEALGLGRNLVLGLINAGQLRVKRVGRRVLVPVAALDEFVKAG